MAAIRCIGLVGPAMGYSRRQIQELRVAIEAADGGVVLAGTPISPSIRGRRMC